MPLSEIGEIIEQHYNITAVGGRSPTIEEVDALIIKYGEQLESEAVDRLIARYQKKFCQSQKTLPDLKENNHEEPEAHSAAETKLEEYNISLAEMLPTKEEIRTPDLLSTSAAASSSEQTSNIAALIKKLESKSESTEYKPSAQALQNKPSTKISPTNIQQRIAELKAAGLNNIK